MATPRNAGTAKQSAPDGFAAALEKATVTPAQAPATGFAAALEKVGLPAADAARYAPNERSTLSHLTPADRELISASTGFVISSDGVVQNPNGRVVDNFIAELAVERATGRLEGAVTSGYLKDLFAKYRNGGESALNPAYLDAALAFMEARDQRRAEDPTPRSSFTIGA
jgi:hypothetical protein